MRAAAHLELQSVSILCRSMLSSREQMPVGLIDNDEVRDLFKQTVMRHRLARFQL
jgi:hypothetical protein